MANPLCLMKEGQVSTLGNFLGNYLRRKKNCAAFKFHHFFLSKSEMFEIL